LINVANRRLGNAERRVADEEDIALSVFASLCLGVQEGRFDRLGDRDDLWKLLVAITSMKSVDQIRRQTAQKRGGGQVRGDSVLMRVPAGTNFAGGFDKVISTDPTPEFIVAMQEQTELLFASLRNEVLRRIATLRLEGHSNPEIAKLLGISVRSVERKLKLIRNTWSYQADC
jgi:DNA-directed RNA polymerase specialized sigma24 family protein